MSNLQSTTNNLSVSSGNTKTIFLIKTNGSREKKVITATTGAELIQELDIDLNVYNVSTINPTDRSTMSITSTSGLPTSSTFVVSLSAKKQSGALTR